MSLELMKHQQPDDWTRENGKEKLWWQENAVGRVFLSSPMSRLAVGYVLKSTTRPREMDRIYDKMNAQEREHNQQLLDDLFNRNRAKYDATRSKLMTKLASGASNAEKNLIREALKLMDAKEEKMRKNSVTGVADIQEHEANNGPKTTKVM